MEKNPQKCSINKTIITREQKTRIKKAGKVGAKVGAVVGTVGGSAAAACATKLAAFAFMATHPVGWAIGLAVLSAVTVALICGGVKSSRVGMPFCNNKKASTYEASPVA